MIHVPLALALLVAPPLPAAARPARLNEVVEAERAFARAARTDGAQAAFLRYSAPDGIVFQPGPRPAKQALAANPIPPVPLDWWPVYAGIAASGDLGFTTGPFVVGADQRKGHGWYFTIWKRQPDGSWRWLLDHGPPTREAAPYGPGSPVTALPPGRPSGKSPAMRSLRAAEAHLAASLAADARTALPRFLAADGRLMRVGPQPAVGLAAWAPVLAAGPERIEAAPLGGEVSAAGDLAYTYGTARWHKDGAPVSGHYVRIWQRRAEGWRLIVDNMIASPPPPPPPAG
ncbi:MAG TPA: nuclear transport factor 2 family protein [Allosphingosinicella sp.]|jgi:ketosteroid isomerase-like protein